MTWQYIAGFFDGEGTIAHNGRRSRIQITQTNQKVLEDIKRFAGIGMICKITKRQAHWKESWAYYITKQGDVYKFLKSMDRYLVVKRSLAGKTLKKLRIYLNMRAIRDSKIAERKRLAKDLRLKGLSYRRIGKTLGIDWGYARRMLIKQGIH